MKCNEKLFEISTTINSKYKGNLLDFVKGEVGAVKFHIQDENDPDYADWYMPLHTFEKEAEIISLWITLVRESGKITLALETEKSLNSGKGGLAQSISVEDYFSLTGDRNMYCLEMLWASLGDIPTTYEGEYVDCIEESFLHFMIGTHREEIWYWFQEQNPKFLVKDFL